MSEFTTYPLGEPILKALEKMGFKEATEIQQKTLPIILEGSDLIGLAATGSGKTAACAIPVCQKIDVDKKGIQALILVPTRELALQYATEVQKVGSLKGVSVLAIVGGEDADLQQAKLRKGVHVAVATPGRLIDFIYSRSIDLQEVETLILDEADEMLNMGFYDDLEFIFQCLVHEHQTLLFSATMPKRIAEIAKNHLKEPKEVKLQQKVKSPEQITHKFLYCHFKDRDKKLCDLMAQEKVGKSIIFCHSRAQVESVCKSLKGSMKGVDYLHAGMSQDVRNIVTNKFRSGKLRHLVATDVASRGLDISDITHVFIYQLSQDPHLYVHRSGRCGRYNKKGTVVSLITKREISVLDRLMKFLKMKPEWIGKGPKS